ncbi:MAG: FKBP-type peptidyl-prolyl cis-trans isomerase [Candidatus Thorarchaeota archaeon]
MPKASSQTRGKSKTPETSADTTTEVADRDTVPVPPQPEEEADVVRNDSMIYVDYVLRTKEDNEIIDVTIEEVAKKEGLYRESDRYEPVLVAIGWNWLLRAVEDSLIGMRVGESKTIEVPPEKGAGQRDPNKVLSIPILKLAKTGAKLRVGERIRFGNDEGVIRQIVGRRVRVDFNRPYAGKTLIFDVTVREIVKGVENKLRAIVKRRIPSLPNDKFGVSVSSDMITIELPKESRYIEGVQFAELGIAADSLRLVSEAKRVRIVVEFDRVTETHVHSDSHDHEEENKSSTDSAGQSSTA